MSQGLGGPYKGLVSADTRKWGHTLHVHELIHEWIAHRMCICPYMDADRCITHHVHRWWWWWQVECFVDTVRKEGFSALYKVWDRGMSLCACVWDEEPGVGDEGVRKR